MSKPYLITTVQGSFRIGSGNVLPADPSTGRPVTKSNIWIKIDVPADSLFKKIGVPSSGYRIWSVNKDYPKWGFRIIYQNKEDTSINTVNCLTYKDDTQWLNTFAWSPAPPAGYGFQCCDYAWYTFDWGGKQCVGMVNWKAVGIPPSAEKESFFPSDNKTSVVAHVDTWTEWDYFIDYIDPSNVKDVPVFPGKDNTDDPAGGDGEGELEDTPIEFPDAPEITVTDAGLMTLYTPTQAQIHAFGDFLWSDAFSLESFKKLFSDPMQAVIGLSIVPVNVPTAGAQPITIGAISSGVNANRAASQYVVHDCGTLKVSPVWNTALDFSPYTKFTIYLPFIGTRDLKTDDIMGKELNVKYFIDVLSGACTAHISVGGSVLYQFSGSCATPVPLSAMNWSSTLTSMIQLAGAGIATAVTGGAAAPVVAGMLTTAAGMASNKPNVQRSGAVSGAAGMLGIKYPYLIRETPRQSLAKDYAHYSGYPSNITAVLGTLKGFTVVENMHLKNIDATADELTEIETALKEGVIL